MEGAVLSVSEMPSVLPAPILPAGGAGAQGGGATTSDFHPHQEHHSTNIFNVFCTALVRFALLWAEVQCGKTGTYHCLIRQMLASGRVARVYILCGSAETTLRDQAFEDARKYNAAYLDSKTIEILFRQDFEKATMNIENALIIVDESHLDQNQGQLLDRFMAKHGLTMAGTNATMTDKNTYMVSVDATPYSEIAALEHKHSLPKHVERVTPPAAYFGVAHYKFNGLVFENYDFRTAAGKASMAAELASHPNKYILMRLTGRRETMDVKETILNELATENDYDIRHYYEELTDVAITRKEQAQLQKKAPAGTVIPCLEDAPETTTIILIKGRLRAGKVVPKQHIGFVWEDATSSKTDVLIQGLFGRMCGYAFGANKPKIFLTAQAIKETPDAVVKASEITRHILGPEVLPTKGTNLKKPRVAKAAVRKEGETVHPLPPILITREMLVAEYPAVNFTDEASAKLAKESIFNYICEHSNTLLGQHANILAKQMEEVLATLEDGFAVEDVSCRFFTESRVGGKGTHHAGEANSFFKQLRQAHSTHTATKEQIDEVPFMTLCITCNDYNRFEAHARGGDIYVVIYTKTSGFVTAVHKESRIASDNGKSVFSIHDTKLAEKAVAVAAVGLPARATLSPVEFELSVREYLRLWSTSTALVYDSAFTSNRDKFMFDSAAFNFESKEKNEVVRILKGVLAKEFGITFRITYAKDLTLGAKSFGISKISWKRTT